MACSTSRQSCDPVNVMAAAAVGCSGFMDPINFQAEQLVYDLAFRDIITNFGVPVNYYINSFNLSGADLLYGEHPTAIFTRPVEMKMYLELQENAIQLSKYGYNSEDELTGYVHITTFTAAVSSVFDYAAVGQYIEPKSGDIVEVSVLGCDRPNGRGSKWFEITERTDQDVAQINPLFGHYVYRIRAKRYEHTFQPGLTGEKRNDQVYENSFAGKLSSAIDSVSASPVKSYVGDIDEDSRNVFDMSVNDNSIYGNYY